MKRLMLVAVAATVFRLTAVWAAPLDGTSWKIKVTPDKEAAENGEKEFDDELIFAEGMVTATACVSHGFKPSVYLVTENDEVMKWQTIQHSEVEGVANWTGQIKDGKLTGKLAWAKRDGTRTTYTFAGEQQPAKTPKPDDRPR